ncbi:DUF3552 domain-containing protein [Pandoraea apista]|uniref:DUF3552 domain-containing protein n=1 Tax=Pandoraea apista TaxID=93218 RepID=UPI000F681B3C|nr:DUF3552 domain-containing protein [Pandoraea apista]RRW90598.1 DUF3552 domain-containing protein [Pandoraea apista]RRX00390.1 DUF3552 domain-containing protein [Pandoraea apista]
MSKQKTPAISVAATSDTFRRVGRIFGRTPQTIAMAELSPEAFKAIGGDASLVVVPTVIEMDESAIKALPYHDAPHVAQAMAAIGTLAPIVDEADKTRALAEREARVTRKAAELDTRGGDLDQREKALGERKSALDTREQALDKRSGELDAREAAVAAREKKAPAAAPEKKAAKAEAEGK